MLVLVADGLTVPDGFRLSSEQFPVMVGRSTEATLRIADSWASRLHCQFEIDNESLIVRDLDSRNGTILNGQPVTEAVLAEGDDLLIGRAVFRIRRVNTKSWRLSGLGQGGARIPVPVDVIGTTIETDLSE